MACALYATSGGPSGLFPAIAYNVIGLLSQIRAGGGWVGGTAETVAEALPASAEASRVNTRPNKRYRKMLQLFIYREHGSHLRLLITEFC